MILRIEPVKGGYVQDLAPRVQGTGENAGEYGYALALLEGENVRVLWDDAVGLDDHPVYDVPAASLIFLVASNVRG